MGTNLGGVEKRISFVTAPDIWCLEGRLSLFCNNTAVLPISGGIP